MLYDHHVHVAYDFAPLLPVLHAERIAMLAEAGRKAGVGICLTEHVYRFVEANAAFEHPFWQASCDGGSLETYVSAVGAVRAGGAMVHLGLEVDWLPEPHMQALDQALAPYVDQWDLLLGSVHWLRAGMYDLEEDSAWEHLTPTELWRCYSEHYMQAAVCGRFDVLTHADAPKTYGPLPPRTFMTRCYTGIADALAAGGVCLEVSTGGLRKQAREIYPCMELLEMCCRRGVPIVLSSDAHFPEDIGWGFNEARAWAYRAGYRELTASITRGERRTVPLHS